MAAVDSQCLRHNEDQISGPPLTYKSLGDSDNEIWNEFKLKNYDTIVH